MDMAEEFQGGGTAWWNPAPRNLFSGGGGVGAFSSPCSVAQLGGGGGNYEMMSSFGWSNEVTKVKSNNISVCDNFFPADMDSTLDVLGFGLSPTPSTTGWNQQNLLCNGTGNEGDLDSILQEDVNSGLSYGMTTNSPSLMNSNSFSSNNSCNPNNNGSPPMALTTASTNSSGDSSTSITCEGGGGGLNTSFPMSSTATYLIQSLFDDIIVDDSQLLLNHQSYGANTMSPSDQLASPNRSWAKPSTPPVQPPPPLLQLEQNNMMNGGRALNNNGQYSTTATALSNVRASLLNSLQSRSRAPTLTNQKSQNSCANLGTKANNNEGAHDSKRYITEQPQAKRPRIETPSSLPTFKVRKEKLGDRITALQQLVSPFGKTDTASVLHEAIEYIKFLHDQVNVLSTPYLKNGASSMQQQQGSDTLNNNEESKHDLRNRGLCLVPISSTYPVAQETPVDFWTPTFGGTIFR